MGAAVIWRILVFYVASIFLIVSVTPWNNVRSGESPFTLALNAMHVPWAPEIIERHHPHRRAFVPQLRVLREFPRAVSCLAGPPRCA